MPVCKTCWECGEETCWEMTMCSKFTVQREHHRRRCCSQRDPVVKVIQEVPAGSWDTLSQGVGRWFWALCVTGSRLQGLEDTLKSWTGGHTGRVPGEGGCNVGKCWAWTHVPATAQRQLSRNLGAEAEAPWVNESHKQSSNCFWFSFSPSILIPTFNTLARRSFFILWDALWSSKKRNELTDRMMASGWEE